jgi:hypothetical protein
MRLGAGRTRTGAPQRAAGVLSVGSGLVKCSYKPLTGGRSRMGPCVVTNPVRALISFTSMARSTDRAHEVAVASWNGSANQRRACHSH